MEDSSISQVESVCIYFAFFFFNVVKTKGDFFFSIRTKINTAMRKREREKERKRVRVRVCVYERERK